MSRYNGSISNLLQGVSQQPRRDRRQEQLGEQTNCYSSVTRGLGKRPGTTYKSSHRGIDTLKDLAMYTYDRGDNIERNTIIADHEKITIIDLFTSGMQFIEPGDTDTSYLRNRNTSKYPLPKDYLKFFTVADTTFVLNKGVVPEMDNPEVTDQWRTCIYMAQANYGKVYRINIDGQNIVSYETPSTVPLTTETQSKSATLKTSEVMGELLNAGATNTPVYVPENRLIGTVVFDRISAINKETFVTNVTADTSQIVAGDTVTIYNTLGEVTGTFPIIRIQVKNGEKCFVLKNDPLAQDPYTPVGRFPVSFSKFVESTTPEPPEDRTLSAWCIANDVTLEASEDNTVLVLSKAFGSHDVEVFDDNNNNDLRVVSDSFTDYSKLPPRCAGGYKVKITGVDTKKENDYYVRFIRDDGAMGVGKGHWAETVGFDVDRSFKPETMPHLLKRGEDGVFTFGPAEWVDRKSGDDNSNPKPSFVGKTIEDIFMYQERLGFLSEENVIASVAYDHFNLFADSVIQGSSSDPIDSASSDSKVTNLRHAVVTNGNIMFFADTAQFVHTGDRAFSSDTFSVASKTHYNMDTLIPPVASAASVFFPYNSGMFTGVREFSVEALTDTASADAVTQHVPEYIRGKPEQLIASTDYNILMVRTETEKNTIYVYEWFDRGDIRQQASWHKWDFRHPVLHIDIIQETLYIWFDTPEEGIILCTMDVSDQNTKHVDYPVRLDLMQTTLGLDRGDYWYIPLADKDSVILGGPESGIVGASVFWRETTFGANIPKKSVPDTIDPPFFIHGIPYDSTFEITTPYVRSAQGEPKTHGRLQILIAQINMFETGFLRIYVDKLYTGRFEKEFVSRIIGHGQYVLNQHPPLIDAIMRVPIRTRDTWCTISGFSDSHLPFYVTSIDWTGEYTEIGRQTI